MHLLVALAPVTHCSGVNRFGVTSFHVLNELEEVARDGGCHGVRSEHARGVEKKSESKKHESSFADCRFRLVIGR
jgi:hypothetical protein